MALRDQDTVSPPCRRIYSAATHSLCLGAYSEDARNLRGQSLQYDDEDGVGTLTHEAIRHMKATRGELDSQQVLDPYLETTWRLINYVLQRYCCVTTGFSQFASDSWHLESKKWHSSER
jgi:hypothetical protein